MRTDQPAAGARESPIRFLTNYYQVTQKGLSAVKLRAQPRSGHPIPLSASATPNARNRENLLAVPPCREHESADQSGYAERHLPSAPELSQGLRQCVALLRARQRD